MPDTLRSERFVLSRLVFASVKRKNRFKDKPVRLLSTFVRSLSAARHRFNSSWRGGSGDESEVFSDYEDFVGCLMPTRAWLPKTAASDTSDWSAIDRLGVT